MANLHGMYHSPEYKAYRNAIYRCRNAKGKQWKDYGGRGIEFRFESFEEFFEHLGKRPTRKHTLDRIDNDGHYEKGNVRWATRKLQMRNQRHPLYGKGSLRIVQLSKQGMSAKQIFLVTGLTLGHIYRTIKRAEAKKA